MGKFILMQSAEYKQSFFWPFSILSYQNLQHIDDQIHDFMSKSMYTYYIQSEESLLLKTHFLLIFQQ